MEKGKAAAIRLANPLVLDNAALAAREEVSQRVMKFSCEPLSLGIKCK